jgi:gamma-D-glutamyl-L-lysine dipeptidyl-peptidase
MRNKTRFFSMLPLALVAVLFFTGCATQWRTAYPYRSKPLYKPQVVTTVKKMGYTIQVGAFSKVENAARLTKTLENQGLDAFYFTHKTGLYKVRFGNYASLAKAQIEAIKLREKGMIGDYYVVSPSEYTISNTTMFAMGGEKLRGAIVSTANTYIGLPYQWGGCTVNGPVDCSGLVMAVYQLNGLLVPRTSQEQFSSGVPVEKDGLQKGDLVFFSTNGDGRVSHVGIYSGEGKFIHAPGTGKTICEESLSRTYFNDRYIGACTYLR